MKTIKVLFALLALQFISIFVLESCCEDIREYVFIDIQAQLSDNQGENPVLLDSLQNRVPASAFAIEVKLENDFWFSWLQNRHWQPFVPTAMATSCDEFYKTDAQIKKINVSVLGDFDNERRNNAEIPDYFKARNLLTDYDAPSDLTSFIDTYNKSLEGEKSSYLGNGFHLFLTQTPSIDSVFQFIITVDLQDDTQLIDTTRQIILY
ncbi:MAG: DUF5034 domain-containing protein [Chitinophagales bacterium]